METYLWKEWEQAKPTVLWLLFNPVGYVVLNLSACFIGWWLAK